MTNLKHKVEALLFSSARVMSLDEIKRLTRAKPEDITDAISQIKEDLKNRNSSIVLEDETDSSWKLTVEDDHIPLVRKIVSKTELKKSLLETLALVAWKAPCLQADIIKMRTNKAYDDLRELESLNYITRQKKGRTKLIKLGQKFFDYFDIPPDKVKQKFSRFEDVAQAITEKEQEAANANKKLEEIKKMQDEEQAKIDKLGELEIIEDDEVSDPDKVETYGEGQPDIEPVEEKVGKLEVFEEPEEYPKEETEESGEKGPESGEEQEEGTEEAKPIWEESSAEETKEEKTEGMENTEEKPEEAPSEETPVEETPEEQKPERPEELTPEEKEEKKEEAMEKEIEKKIDDKIDEMFHPK